MIYVACKKKKEKKSEQQKGDGAEDTLVVSRICRSVQICKTVSADGGLLVAGGER